jgi:hypothetical protein
MTGDDSVDGGLGGMVIDHVEWRGLGPQSVTTQGAGGRFKRVKVAAISDTVAPASASPLAMARPRPHEAPVIRATRPSSENKEVSAAMFDSPNNQSIPAILLHIDAQQTDTADRSAAGSHPLLRGRLSAALGATRKGVYYVARCCLPGRGKRNFPEFTNATTSARTPA